MEPPEQLGKTSFKIQRVHQSSGAHDSDMDVVAIEEPLEIRIGFVDDLGEHKRKTISITMRTPGYDFELALGFLYTEGLVRQFNDTDGIRNCGSPSLGGGSSNTVRVDFKRGVKLDLKRLERHFYTSSSCGVCGKSSIEALKIQSPFDLHKNENLLVEFPLISNDTIHSLPRVLREAQRLFEATGGLHASALFSLKGELKVVREDVGRHNALDKVIGWSLMNGKTPLSDSILLVSGRASFELVQKASMAGIPVLAAVGAPSSLAVELARETGMTLLGFVRNERFNIYCGDWRMVQ